LVINDKEKSGFADLDPFLYIFGAIHSRIIEAFKLMRTQVQIPASRTQEFGFVRTGPPTAGITWQYQLPCELHS